MQHQEPAGTDAQLEALAAGGNRDAFTELYERHFDRVYDFLRRMVSDADEAADLAQETFLRAMRALSPKEKKASFATWLFTIARNLALKRLEKRRRTVVPEEREEEPELAAYRQVDPDRFADPQAAAESHELAGLVWQAAAGLSPKEYSLLDLHVRQGLDSAEIAHVLGVSKGNAYTMMSRLKDTFESAVAALQLLQRGREECQELNRLLEGQRITFISPDARRLIDRHAAGCPTCQEQRRRLVSPTAIFGSFAAVPVPFGLKPRVAEALIGLWAEAGSEAPGALKALISRPAATFRSLPTAWKAALLTGMIIGAIVGGLGGWIGVGGGLSLFGGGDREEGPGALAALAAPSPTPLPTPEIPGREDTAGPLRMAFEGESGGIWLIDFDGSNEIRLVDDGLEPAWSPDGSRIAFAGPGAPWGDIWVMDADGSNQTNLSASSGLDTMPAWSPEGSKIALHRGPGDGAIYVIDADGSNETHLTDDGRYPSWSPDGSRIAFLRGFAIYVVNSDGTNETLVAPTTTDVGPPAWSPDGFRLAFGVTGVAEVENGIYVVDADGSNLTRLTEGGVNPSWSPDGSRILLGLHIVNADDSNLTQLEPAIPPGGPYGSASGPAWSPDGSLIAYKCDPEPKYDGRLCIMNADGSDARVLTDNIFYLGRFAWQPVAAPAITPAPTSTPVVLVPTQTPKPCPVADATFCDFVYEINAALTRSDTSFILSRTRFTEHTCGYFADLEGPPLRGGPPSVCEGQPRDVVPECVDWTLTGVAHPYYVCLTKEEYAQQLSSVPYTPTEFSETVAVIGIDFDCSDLGCRGTLFLRDPTEPLSGDPEFDNGVFLTVVERAAGWTVSGGGCCLPFLYSGYPEFPWQ